MRMNKALIFIEFWSRWPKKLNASTGILKILRSSRHWKIDSGNKRTSCIETMVRTSSNPQYTSIGEVIAQGRKPTGFGKYELASCHLFHRVIQSVCTDNTETIVKHRTIKELVIINPGNGWLSIRFVDGVHLDHLAVADVWFSRNRIRIGGTLPVLLRLSSLAHDSNASNH